MVASMTVPRVIPARNSVADCVEVQRRLQAYPSELEAFHRPADPGKADRSGLIMMEQDAVVAAIRSSTADVFSTMLSLDVESEDPRTELNPPGPSDGIVAVIGLAGAWVGTGSLCCSTSMACRMTSNMLGMECEEVNEDVLDD